MENQFSQVEEGSSSAGKENDNIEWKDKLEIDFSYDYSEDIKAEIDDVVSDSASLQKELENIEEMIEKYTGESFVMPEISAKYGLFIDNQGTGNVYNSLITQQNLEGDDEAIISIHYGGDGPVFGVF